MPSEDTGSGSDSESSSSRSRSNSPETRNRSVSPAGSKKTGSASPENADHSRFRSSSRSASGSPKRKSRSRSNSPQHTTGSNRSRSPSGSGSRSSSSGSAASEKNKNARQAGENDRSIHSPSGSPKGKSRSPSGSPKSKSQSPSGSPQRNRSRSGSRNRSRSGSGSTASPRKGSRSRSGTPRRESTSRSPSPHKSRSRSGSASPHVRKSRSRSGSRTSQKSAVEGSPFRSHSGSPKVSLKRKRAVFSDDSSSDVVHKKSDAKRGASDAESGDDNLVIDAEALFGDASDISSDEEGKKGRKEKKQSADEADGEQIERPSSPVDSEKAVSGEEKEETGVVEEPEEEPKELEPLPETRIDVEIPKISTNLGKEIHFVKLPNFLSVETRPFDRDTYEDEIDEEETLDEEGRARLKLKVENTIRWREIAGPDGLTKQSNARIVRWSDGSFSLHLGSEIFDVYKQPLQGDHNHLFVRQGTGLQGQAVFRTKLTFRPHSTESFTHRKMTMSLADRSLKTSGIKVLSLVGKDPEANRGELIKKEEEKLRATVRRESRQKRIREKGASRGLSASYLEPDRDDSDDEGISISAIKRQHKNKVAQHKGDRPNIYSSDEEASDMETRRARRLDKAKALKDSDSEENSAKENSS